MNCRLLSTWTHTPHLGVHPQYQVPAQRSEDFWSWVTTQLLTCEAKTMSCWFSFSLGSHYSPNSISSISGTCPESEEFWGWVTAQSLTCKADNHELQASFSMGSHSSPKSISSISWYLPRGVKSSEADWKNWNWVCSIKRKQWANIWKRKKNQNDRYLNHLWIKRDKLWYLNR